MATWNMIDVERMVAARSLASETKTSQLGLFSNRAQNRAVSIKLRPAGLVEVYRMLGEDYAGNSEFNGVKLRFNTAEQAKEFQTEWELHCNTKRSCPFKLIIDDGVQHGENQRGNLLSVESPAVEVTLVGSNALEELAKHIDLANVNQSFRGFNNMLIGPASPQPSAVSRFGRP